MKTSFLEDQKKIDAIKAAKAALKAQEAELKQNTLLVGSWTSGQGKNFLTYQPPKGSSILLTATAIRHIKENIDSLISAIDYYKID